ncbi:oligosaccharide repeat unit polymerase [Azonexus sp.]|uniref:oligosaccharide repeat unit polymerase n=1 Tax=Azonexus sp. TaxID=1872668 RepID=UPI0035B27AEF
MDKVLHYLALSLTCLLLAIFSGFLALFDLLDESVVALIFAYFILFRLAKFATNSYTNVYIVYIVFSILYGISGPVAVQWGGGLNEIFPKPYRLQEITVFFSLSIVGTVLGLIAGGINSGGDKTSFNTRLNLDVQVLNIGTLYRCAIFFLGLASVFELLNIQRAGGLEIIFLGKAFYQSAIAELTGVVPTLLFMMLGAALLGLYLSSANINIKRNSIYAFLFASPWLLIMLISGRRGALVSIVLIVSLGYCYWKPIRLIKFKYIALTILFYSAMVALYVVRSQVEHAFATGNMNVIEERLLSSEVWSEAINPANNEFAAPFGNINTYILRNTDGPSYGGTYVSGLASAVPSILWPNKPKQELYNFRDKYFPEEALRGAVASTAYSSILEAYVNFRELGIVLVYMTISFLLIRLEKYRLSSRNIFVSLYYLLLTPIAISFHRSSLDASFLFPAIFAGIGVVILKILGSYPRIVYRSRS